MKTTHVSNYQQIIEKDLKCKIEMIRVSKNKTKAYFRIPDGKGHIHRATFSRNGLLSGLYI